MIGVWLCMLSVVSVNVLVCVLLCSVIVLVDLVKVLLCMWYSFRFVNGFMVLLNIGVGSFVLMKLWRMLLL